MIPNELKALYPKLSDEDLAAVMENLDQYLLLAWEIMEDAEGASTAPPVDSGKDHR
jgi:hypothetical protein